MVPRCMLIVVFVFDLFLCVCPHRGDEHPHRPSPIAKKQFGPAPRLSSYSPDNIPVLFKCAPVVSGARQRRKNGCAVGNIRAFSSRFATGRGLLKKKEINALHHGYFASCRYGGQDLRFQNSPGVPNGCERRGAIRYKHKTNTMLRSSPVMKEDRERERRPREETGSWLLRLEQRRSLGKVSASRCVFAQQKDGSPAGRRGNRDG